MVGDGDEGGETCGRRTAVREHEVEVLDVFCFGGHGDGQVVVMVFGKAS